MRPAEHLNHSEGPSPLMPFVRASTFHIGAAAAAAALRHELTERYGLPEAAVDRAYAVSRLTPGTNQLAMYAVLGHRLGGWGLAVKAVLVGAVVPSVIAIVLAMLYTQTDSAGVAALMRGARAGGVAVLIGAAVRLIRPHLAKHPIVSTSLALTLAVVAVLSTVSAFTLLLAGAAVGALVLRA